ncbi:MAG: NB-ARC domain-containing protein [Gaiellaceae bacterium]
MALPTGPDVAFMFTDIEGSTRTERAVGSAVWAGVVARHDELMRRAIERHGGSVVKTEGDAFFAAFPGATEAVAAAADAQRALAIESWAGGAVLRVRMGVHLGEGRLRARLAAGDPEDYVGIDVNYAARIAAAANGGQIVLSAPLVAALPPQLDGLPGMEDAGVVEDGLRAVKDFDEPAPLFRLVVSAAADDDRPLRTTEVPSNLPGDVTSLVGRETEIELVHRDLDAARIVTLTGPGGSGKTRLAVAAARELRDRYPHGVWLVDLATVADVGLVEPAIATAVGVRESPERTMAEALRAHLRDRTALLVLDNLEQLLPAAAHVVAGLVRSAPHVRVLLTSRELLRIAGERPHHVPPLDPDEGIALFIDRARAHRPDLALTEDTLAAVRAIAERLGGLPLALELAAARVRMLTPRLILQRLGRSLDLGGGARDLPERQRTLRGAIGWSYELLPDPERRLFGRLGVFASGWTLESALAVAGPDMDLGIDIVEGIESLADKSLVRIEPAADGDPSADAGPRFSMHPLLREFALERLGESGERSAVEERFVAECVGIAERAGAVMLATGGEAAMAVLDGEERNLRAALDWTLAHDAPTHGLRIMGPTWRWFQGRGRLREARSTLSRLLESAVLSDPRVRIAALAAAGGRAYWMRDFAAAGSAYEERLALAQETGDEILTADAHYDLGFIAMVSQDDATLRAHEERALKLYTEAGHEDGAVLTREALVLSLFLGGEYARARELETLNLDVFRRAGSQMQVASASTLLSAVEWRAGHIEHAWQRLIDALSLFHSLEHPPGLTRTLGLASIMLLSGGPSELGARVAGATYRLVRENGLMLGPVHVLHLPEPSVLAEARFGVERAAELLAEGEQITTDDLVAALAASPPPGAPLSATPEKEPAAEA